MAIITAFIAVPIIDRIHDVLILLSAYCSGFSAISFFKLIEKNSATIPAANPNNTKKFR